MRRYGRGSGRHRILKKTGKVVGIVTGVVIGTVLVTSLGYWAATTTNDYDANGALNNDLSASTDADNKTQDPIDKIDQSHDKYESATPDVDEIINDGQIHDEDGKNDPNRSEIDDPYGYWGIEETTPVDEVEQEQENVVKYQSKSVKSSFAGKATIKKDNIYKAPYSAYNNYNTRDQRTTIKNNGPIR